MLFRKVRNDSDSFRWQLDLTGGPVVSRGTNLPFNGVFRCLVPDKNASALSEARFYESVKSGEVLSARSIEPFEGGRPVCGGRGCYANSIEGRVGLAPQLGCAGEHGCQR
jgi:hypothetical protein